MLCANCNARLEHDYLFCGDCGTPVASRANTSSFRGGSAPLKAQQPIAPAMSAASVNAVKMPLVFVIDISADAASYLGELNKELNKFKTNLSADSLIASMLDIAIVQFGEKHRVVLDYISIQYMDLVRFAPASTPNSAYDPPIREALRLVMDYTQRHRLTHKPWIVLIAGSSPADDILSVANEVKASQGHDALRLIALGVDKCDFVSLNRLTDVVFRQDGIRFASFFEWLSESMRVISQTPHGQKPQLPNLQGNVYRDK